MEKILSIKETTFKKNANHWASYDGYEITTDKQVIKIGIGDDQNCCERWGYFITEDNLDEYIGSNLINISHTDMELNTKQLDDLDVCADETRTMFITFETTNGSFQFVAYNSHNGYYGHYAIVISEQLNIEECL